VGFVLTIAMVWLGGQVVTQGLSDHLLSSDPELAVLWRGDSADAVAALARQRLIGGNREGAVRLAARALQLAPLNGSALTTSGVALDQLGHEPRANAAMAVAGKLSWRDVVAQIWLLRQQLLFGDFDAAMNHADALLRRQDDVPAPLLAALTAAARDPRMTEPLARHLAADPAWREPFIAYLSVYARPPATDVARALLVRLARGPTPPSEDELAVYLRSLVGAEQFSQAAQDWRLFGAGARQTSLIYDGDFERPPGQTPFDWTLENGVGWTATIADAPEGGQGQALRVNYDGVSPPKLVRQMLILPPGAFRLSGRVFDDGDGDPKALAWGVACASSRQVLGGVTTPGARGVWTSFALTFAVPPSACPAQWLVLSAAPGDMQRDITAWYDDIAVAALAPVAPPKAAANP
jgi:hypothetical protein